jgi:tetratricopeptide (TPR) repeat protein
MLLALGQRVVWGGSVLQAGLIERLAGDYGAAEELYRASVASADGAPSYQATIALNLAYALYAQGRFEEADVLCREGENHPDNTDVVTACMSIWLRALLLAHNGDLSGACRRARAAVDMTDARKSIDTRIEALLALAEVEVRAGAQSALTTLRELTELIDERGYTAMRGRTDQLQDRLSQQT